MPTVLVLLAVAGCRPAPRIAADFTLGFEEHVETFVDERAEHAANCTTTDASSALLHFPARPGAPDLSVTFDGEEYLFLDLGSDWLAQPGSPEAPELVHNVSVDGCAIEVARSDRSGRLTCDGPAYVAVLGDDGALRAGAEGWLAGAFEWTCPDPPPGGILVAP